MPIATVEIVVDAGQTPGDDLAQMLADAIGRVLGSPPSGTWVRLRLLERDRYAENGGRLDASELPVFVTLIKRHLPTDAELDAEVAALTRAVAQATGRPAERVHIEYAPAAANRIAFGGTVVR